MKLNEERVHERLDRSDNSMQSSTNEQRQLWTKFEDQVDENNKLISSENAVASQIMKRVNWIRTLGQDMKTMMQGIFTMTFLTFRAVTDIRSYLVSHLERPLYKEPMILEDSLGRSFPISLQFISSWDALTR